jgi:hypothetical protein
MFNFLIAPIRQKDRDEGEDFVWRWTRGPQQEWEDYQARVESVKDLWDIVNIKDPHLQLLKNILGWTADLENITDRLDDATLRRLLENSWALWKERGPEDTIIDVLRLVTGQRVRIWNWFDFRWVLDETGMGEEHQGRDPWLIELPGPPASSEYHFNVRIVDNGLLDRVLVKDLLSLMRPNGERIELTYIDFLDMFDLIGDDSQWDIPAGVLDVSGGTAKLSDDTIAEQAVSGGVITNAADWEEYSL